MIENGNIKENDILIFSEDQELRDGLKQIKNYLEKNIRDLSRDAEKKDSEITQLKDTLEKARYQAEGNTQLINKLLGELSKLQNDIDWYKRTYEKRSLLGTIRQKLFRK